MVMRASVLVASSVVVLAGCSKVAPDSPPLLVPW